MTARFAHPELQRSVQFLRGVGPARIERLAKIGIATIADLIRHFPRGYEDLSDVRGIDQIEAGVLQTIVGELVEFDGKHLENGKRIASAVIADEKGRCVEGVWFNQITALRPFRYGMKVAFSGKPKWFRDHWTMQHPRVQILEDTGGQPSGQVIPIYPLTESIRAEDLREWIRAALTQGVQHCIEILPASVRERHHYPEVKDAFWQLHFPEVLPQARLARRRFIYEEFLLLQIALAARRREIRDRQQAPRLPMDTEIDARIRKLLPFRLTDDQNLAVRAICKDLASDRPMQRLLQADVGAGKTAVAIYAMLAAVANKHQAALMAPTEILARQHSETLDRFLAHSRVRRLLLTGSLTSSQRQQALHDLAAGNVDLVVGTQALVQEDVRFAKLGLVVIDEQHKFGVQQRARIRKLGVDPHYLVMTATPIPRTIALTVFGDLDVSSIHELPPGRQPVKTQWHSESQRDRIYDRIRLQLREGRQAYVVCPLVEESESLDLKAAEQTAVELQQGPFAEFKVGLLHGRMSDDEKQRAMHDFRERKLHLLVSTVAIEVGIDVANATVMLIEHAERFGLSQLHQLRGRVSRGEEAGECHLFTGTTTEEARTRLRIFTRTTDGFALAEEDARIRGLGEFFGSRQSGVGDLVIGDFLADRDILEQARDDAFALMSADPGLRQPQHAALRQAVLERFGASMDLAQIG
ncbi:MAG: ATP-dependent DNA helicase RecG [Gemmataceae bacterium]|nr:ATP-dependent DNA helicase RecG [Gemmataceae bacterium]